MSWMNEHEVAEMQRMIDPADTPNLAEGAYVLGNLVEWTNSNSDGWPYWQKPSNAAKPLMALLGAHTYAARFGYYQGTSRTLEDVSEADLRKALAPIKTFLTRQGIDHNAVLPWAALLPAA